MFTCTRPNTTTVNNSNTSSKKHTLTLQKTFSNYIPANKLLVQSNEINMTTIMRSQSIKKLNYFVTIPAVWVCDYKKNGATEYATDIRLRYICDYCRKKIYFNDFLAERCYALDFNLG